MSANASKKNDAVYDESLFDVKRTRTVCTSWMPPRAGRTDDLGRRPRFTFSDDVTSPVGPLTGTLPSHRASFASRRRRRALQGLISMAGIFSSQNDASVYEIVR